MIVDVTQRFINLETGKEMKEEREPDKEGKEKSIFVPFTLRLVCVRALCGTFPGDEKIKGDKKLEYYQMAVRINKEDHVNLKSEEIVLLKERINKGWGALIVGQAYQMLEKMAEPVRNEKK